MNLQYLYSKTDITVLRKNLVTCELKRFENNCNFAQGNAIKANHSSLECSFRDHYNGVRMNEIRRTVSSPQ